VAHRLLLETVKTRTLLWPAKLSGLVKVTLDPSQRRGTSQTVKLPQQLGDIGMKDWAQSVTELTSHLQNLRGGAPEVMVDAAAIIAIDKRRMGSSRLIQ
jgi:hypothetical protein